MTAKEPSALTGQFETLKSRFNDLLERVNFTEISRQISSIAGKVAALPGDIERIRSRGYVFASYLENKAQTLARHWEDSARDARQTIARVSAELRGAVQQAEQSLRKAEGVAQSPLALAGLLPTLEREIADAEARLKAAEERVKAVFQTLANDVDQTARQLQDIRWYLDQKDEASFPFLAGEALFLAAKAEWVASGKGKEDPDGILYLTDQRLIFEQKETTGKTLGLFGGKKVQELEWDIPLNTIEQVKAENKGLFGGKDMLYFTLRPGARFAQITVEVKGGANCKFWAAQIQRMVRGETTDERAVPPDPEMLEALRSAPTACHVCGATLPQIVAGQREITCAYCGTVIRL